MTQGVYTYPTSSLAYGDGVTASPAGQVYPNADLTLAGELQPLGACQSAPNVWQGEFDNANTVMQHLLFLIWERNPNATITLAGGSGQNWWGIIYNPGNGAPTPCSNPNQCSVTLTGNSGGFDGPPMLAGQVIADNVSISGAATVEVFYRPCPTTSTCDTGPGTGLVE
jgi:hypothetical protein